MISVILTSSQEIHMINNCIDHILPQLDNFDELIIISPDEEMLDVVNKYKSKFKNIFLLKDKKEGKPTALNMGLKVAKGDILILNDGDTYIKGDAIKFIEKHFDNKNCGAVSGHPVSIDRPDTIFGYWAQVLTEIAHNIRIKRSRNNNFFECSGYLYAFRRGLVKIVTIGALADDAAITHEVAKSGYTIEYEPNAIVYVKYPKNYKDWLSQKVRSTGGYVQQYVINSEYKMRGFLFEAITGAKTIFIYANSLKKLCWILLLLLARLHVWLLVFVKVIVMKLPLIKLWTSVRSTK